MKISKIWVLVLMMGLNLQAKDLIINEVMCSNQRTVFDGGTPDWIELYNRGEAAIDLGDYSLSDDYEALKKWPLPAIELPAKHYLLILASGKDCRTLMHYETIITENDPWKYKLGSASLPSSWNTNTYDDDAWSEGASGFGYDDDDDGTVINSTVSVCIRKEFSIEDLDHVQALILHLDYDDAFVAYINGQEVARSNIGQVGDRPAYDALASANHEALMYRDQNPEEFVIEDFKSLLREGENTIAIQAHNVTANSSDMSVIPFLTLGLSQKPENSRGVADFIDSQESYLQTNFSIKTMVERVYLTDAAGIVVDYTTPAPAKSDISMGRKGDVSNAYYFFTSPTPGGENTTTAYTRPSVSAPVFSVAAGFFTDSIRLAISAAEGESIYYTLDGAEPDTNALLYTQPLRIDTTTVVRAVSKKENSIYGPTATHTYIRDRGFFLPVISLTTDPFNLWDYYTGIYAMGPNADPDPPYSGANFREDWERPVHFEMYEKDGRQALKFDGGIKITGGRSRQNAQKAFAIYARDEYGTSKIKYKFFEQKDYDELSSFKLRNSGNEWCRTNFRDGCLSSLAQGTNVDYLAYKSSIVFLNGVYWGILNIREKPNEDYLADNHTVDPDNVDILQQKLTVVEGDNVHYKAMLDFMETHDMSLSENYDYVKTLMDVHNFMDYYIIQLYIDNEDWPSNNIKYWRPKTPLGKWKWILYDTDAAFNGFNSSHYSNNSIEFATYAEGTKWPNPAWSTYLFRTMLENEDFKSEFANRFADRLNTRFVSDSVVAKINAFAAEIATEIPYHFDRWINNMDTWEEHIGVLTEFANKRPEYMFSHIANTFGYGDRVPLGVDVSPVVGGRVKLNSMKITNYPWQGIYFRENPVTLLAQAELGYAFSHWSGVDDSTSAQIVVDLSQDISGVVAYFDRVGESQSIIINEICYKGTADIAPGDWVELHNPNAWPIDLAGWTLSDANSAHNFEFPLDVVIPADDYLVVCEDDAAFQRMYPSQHKILGNMSFGFSAKGDYVFLHNDRGQLIDSVLYYAGDPWPDLAASNGVSLELNHPLGDNSMAENWSSSSYGTPCESNENVSASVYEADAHKGTTGATLAIYPNPIKDWAMIDFSIAKHGRVSLAVYNLRGQKVDQILDQGLCPGQHKKSWTGGQALPTGLYVLILDSDSGSLTRKILIVE